MSQRMAVTTALIRRTRQVLRARSVLLTILAVSGILLLSVLLYFGGQAFRISSPPSGSAAFDNERARGLGKSRSRLLSRLLQDNTALSGTIGDHRRSGEPFRTEAELIGILLDTKWSITERLALLQGLSSIDAGAGAWILVKATSAAHRAGDTATKDELLKVLERFTSLEQAEAFFALLEQENTGGPDEALPDDLRYALIKTLRSHPAAEMLGELFQRAYKDGSEPTRAVLEKINQPNVNARLAIDAYEANDGTEFAARLEHLFAVSVPGVVDATMTLAKSTAGADTRVADRITLWVRDHPDPAVETRLVEYLSGHDSTTSQRALAAAAMGGLKSDGSLSALNKAYRHDGDPAVRAAIQLAIKNARGAAH